MKPRPVLLLAAFVFWLHAVPMEGLLRQDCMGKGCLLFFLLPHALSLLALARFEGLIHRPRLVDLSVLVVFTLTTFFPSSSEMEHLALTIMGVFAAPLLIRICLLLKDEDRPLFSAAMGVCVGQLPLLLIPILAGPVPLPGFFFLAGLPLLFLMGQVAAVGSQESPTEQYLQGQFPRLAMIFLFFAMQGLFFGNVISTYGTMRSVQEWGVLPYILAVILGALLARRHLDQTFGAAVGLAILALGMWPLQDLFTTNPTIVIMIAASGFADMFVLAVLLSPKGSVLTMGLASGIMCLGMAVGKAGEMALGGLSESVLMLAHVMLGAAILCVYLLPVFFRGRELLNGVEQDSGTGDRTENVTSPQEKELCEEDDAIWISKNCFEQLSDQERKVLALFAQGMTSRESADTLGLAQSTVKTYMRRIYAKTKTNGKKSLRERIALQSIEADHSRELPSKDKSDVSV